jgi:DNA polymerase III epsilon subunit-like protein
VGYELVDAESPEWPPRPGRRPPPTPASSPTAADVDALVRHVRLRLERDLARRRARPLPRVWADVPLAAARFCVIDLETTGMGPGGDEEILEIDLGREFSTVVDPRRPVSWAARAVHGISDAEIGSAPRLQQALPWLLETVQERVLVFHNAGFDLPFLQRALQEAGRDPFEQPVVDTLRLARRLAGGSCSLGALVQRFGLTASRLHRAAADARATAELLVRFLALYAEAEAVRLGEIAGISSPNAHARRRRRDPTDPLAERLERAIARGEIVRVTVHAGAGLAPVELEIVPLALLGARYLQARDVGLGIEIGLAVDRIGCVMSV